MKNNIIFMLAMAMLLPVVICAQTTTVLVNSEWACSDNWGNGYQQVAVSNLTNLAEGDKLQIEVTAKSKTAEWPQVALKYSDKNWNWKEFAEADPLSVGLWGVTTFPYTAEFTFTKTMVDSLLAGQALIISGSGYTACKATLIHYSPLSTGTKWQGEKVMPTDWGAWLTLPASKFADAKIGWTLRLMASDVASGAQAQLSSAAWKCLANKSFGGKYVDFELTQDILMELQQNGVNINGCGYTLTAVKLFDPSATVKYTTTLNITQPDWTWSDTKPTIGLKINNPSASAVRLPVQVDVTTDKGEIVKSYKQSVDVNAFEESEVNIRFSDIRNPGIYRFTTYVNGEQVSYTRSEDKAYTWTTLNIAYKPTEISSSSDAQSDFKAYWDDAKAQLKSVDMNAQLELVQEGTYRNLYRLTLNSIPNGTSGNPVQIRGYYAEVKAEGTYPCIIYYMGYDSDHTSTLWHPGADDRQNYNELIISPRGQSFGNRIPYKDDNFYCNTSAAASDDNIANGKWFTYHFGDKDSYYYRGAYMDQVRGIDFVCSRNKVDKKNIFATGSSQGGAFTIVAAALADGRINAIAPAIQFMGDFPDYFKVGTWPVSEAKNAAKWKGMTEAEMYTFLSYYDTKNFASMITAPTMSSIGLQDNVCPAHTNLAPFNLLTCEKKLYINKNLVHETPSNNSWSNPNNSERDWTALCNDWWTEHMQTTGIETIDSSEDTAHYSACYNVCGQKVGFFENGQLKDVNYKGIIIINGKKLINK